MIQKILIANRGEIALRIVRACRELGIKTLAVYSEADVQSLHVQLADEAICIGGPKSADSYLRADRIISAAEIADVDAIHPGYGFLSENAKFAEQCESCNIKFIGPKSQSIKMMGDKSVAKDTVRKAGVPIVPGSDGPVESESEAVKVARKMGYPVIIKAVAGGGGRGMRIAHNDVSFAKEYHVARNEAEKAFGNGQVYVEKYIEKPRHIEFQILADSHGKTVHLGERDCSVQRRHQKLIEESPSPFLTPDLRKKMGKAAIRAAEAAQSDEFIRALPAGYQTKLGERGVVLSGGQRQRLAIARAILKNAPILLLDEATSALDAQNEMLVQRALEGVMQGRTTLVIAHRLATVQKANRIVVLDNGRIVEDGTHAELKRNGGLYSRLAELQFAAEAAQ